VKTAIQALSYGASLVDGRAEFRIWAPWLRAITLRLTGHTEAAENIPPNISPDIPMEREGEDFIASAAAGAGDRYLCVFDDGLAVPDPVSRFLPQGVNGPTEIVDPSAFSWNDGDWRGLDLLDYVIYELHVGTFTPPGNFDGVIGKLDYLKQLGVTVIEIMPVAACPGQRNWGYDGVSLYAVQANYGGPDGLKRLVDAAHRAGLGVILDVVYNHVGPEGNYLPRFAPYFTSEHRTPWGDAVNYDRSCREHVRRYMIENALYWIHEYHIDGLRLDAVQTIADDSPKPIVAEMQEQVQALACELGRTVCVIAETDENDSRYIKPASAGGYALDAVWSDDFHHAVHAFFTGERDGYYQDYSDPAEIARALREGYIFQGQMFRFWNRPRGTSAKDVPQPANVICTQNHDQVGNRAKGDRLTTLVPRGVRKLTAALLLLAPHTPMLFMGQEYDEAAPFQFFADFENPALRKAVSEGRRSEFKDFDFNDVPDPSDPATFERSRLTWADGPQNREMRVPADAPKLIVQAALVKDKALPHPPDGWNEVLQSNEDGYAVKVFVRRNGKS
jgi:maltooligosyltrehalose trehalohydrolase